MQQPQNPHFVHLTCGKVWGSIWDINRGSMRSRSKNVLVRYITKWFLHFSSLLMSFPSCFITDPQYSICQPCQVGQKNCIFERHGLLQVIATVSSTFSWWRRQCSWPRSFSQQCMVPARSAVRHISGHIHRGLKYHSWYVLLMCAAVSVLL